MPSLGPAEILVILVVALLVFGPEKMPEIARQVGKGFREFRRVQQHLKSELRDVVSEFDSPSSGTSVEQQAVPMLPPREDPAAEAAEVPEPPAAAPTEAPATGAATHASSTDLQAASAPPSGGSSAPVPDTPAPLPTPEPDAPSEPA